LVRATVGVVLAAALGTACAVTEPEAVSSDFLCDGDEVAAEVLTDPRPATELGPDGRLALAGRGVPYTGALSRWTIEQESDTHVVLTRERDRPWLPSGPDGVRQTHDKVAVEAVARQDGSGQVWQFYGGHLCDLQRDVRPLNAVHLTLDPDQPAPDPTSIELFLLAEEKLCAGIVPSQDRVQLLSVVETPTEVRVVAGIQPSEGGDCAGNIPASIVIELDEPLGDRAVVDDTVHPSRVLTDQP
jgi:hypothetical protein